MTRFMLTVLVILSAEIAFASQEGALPISRFRLESDGIGQSGKIVVEGKQNDKAQLVELTVKAFGKDHVVPPKKLETLGELRANGIRISYETGYEELGGRTVYIQLQLGFTSHTAETALITITETGKIAVSRRKAKSAASGSSRTSDDTKGGPSVCEVHHVAMTRRAVPWGHGTVPMHSSEDKGAYDRRMAYYPHPGDCEPATDIVLPGQKGLVEVLVCPECERVKRQVEKANP